MLGSMPGTFVQESLPGGHFLSKGGSCHAAQGHKWSKPCRHLISGASTSVRVRTTSPSSQVVVSSGRMASEEKDGGVSPV